MKNLLLISCFLISVLGYSKSGENNYHETINEGYNLALLSNEVTVDCEEEPVNSVWCYGLNEAFQATYTSSDADKVLNLTVNSGEVYNYGQDFIILDSDGSTILYSGIGNNGDLSGISVQSTGDQITIMDSSG